MNEIISGVQVIKMYAWEKPFARLITVTRKLELKIVSKVSYIRAFHMTSMIFTARIALFCTMLTIISIHGPGEITSARIFVISSYFNIVSHLIAQRFSRAIAETAEVLVALKRLEKFLYLEEKKTNFDDEKLGNGLENGSKKTRNKVWIVYQVIYLNFGRKRLTLIFLLIKKEIQFHIFRFDHFKCVDFNEKCDGLLDDTCQCIFIG